MASRSGRGKDGGRPCTTRADIGSKVHGPTSSDGKTALCVDSFCLTESGQTRPDFGMGNTDYLVHHDDNDDDTK
ncbi:hypothetical protein VTH06DRAFT_6990 [Thermothelomyces fergusii]